MFPVTCKMPLACINVEMTTEPQVVPFSPPYAKGCRIGRFRVFLVTMKSDSDRIRRDVAAHRQRLREAGRTFVNTDLPVELVARLDRIKEERGASSRAPIIEEALRFYIEAKQGT